MRQTDSLSAINHAQISLMGFTGRPSAGCATCKQRKKKCDLTKPYCIQCTSHARVCSGVPDEVDILFRNKFVPDLGSSVLPSSKKISKPRRNQPAKDAVVPRSKVIPHSNQVGNRDLSVIVPSVRTDWLSTATTYYFNLHCNKDLLTRRLNPWLELQSQFYTSSKAGTALSHAVNALAAMTMADDLQLPQLTEVANTAYGNALRTINTALADPIEAKKNDVAVGIFAMTSFELKQKDANRHVRYQAHIEGMKQLLLLRGRQQLADIQSLRVFRALRVQIIYDHMLRGQKLFSKGDGMIWTDASPYNATPVDDLCAIAARIPDLRYPIKQLPQPLSGVEATLLVSDALRIENKLSRWLAKWLDHLNYETTFTLETGRGLWKGRAHVFTDISLAVLMNHYYLLHILVLDSLLNGYKMCSTSNQETRTKEDTVLSHIHQLIDSICFSIPFITGQVREKGQNVTSGSSLRWIYPSHAEATWILLPIVVAAQQASISVDQKSWLRQQLIWLNADFGLIDASSMPRGTEEKLQLTPPNS